MRRSVVRDDIVDVDRGGQPIRNATPLAEALEDARVDRLLDQRPQLLVGATERRAVARCTQRVVDLLERQRPIGACHHVAQDAPLVFTEDRHGVLATRRGQLSDHFDGWRCRSTVWWFRYEHVGGHRRIGCGRRLWLAGGGGAKHQLFHQCIELVLGGFGLLVALLCTDLLQQGVEDFLLLVVDLIVVGRWRDQPTRDCHQFIRPLWAASAPASPGNASPVDWHLDDLFAGRRIDLQLVGELRQFVGILAR